MVQCRIPIPAEQGAGMVQIRALTVEAWINGDGIAAQLLENEINSKLIQGTE